MVLLETMTITRLHPVTLRQQPKQIYRQCTQTLRQQVSLTELIISFSISSLNIASGSYTHMTILSEIEFFNFLWLILVHYLSLPPT